MAFIDTYQAVRNTTRQPTMRSRIRHLVLNGISYGISNKAPIDKPRIQFLLFHHTFKDEESNFDRLLNALAKEYSFISYTEAIEKIRRNDIDRPYLCFTSDDGFKNNLRAAKVLNRYNVKCCFFVCPGIIGVTDYQKITSFNKLQLNFPPVEYLNWNDLDELKRQGHEIGGHTLHHINLVTTPLEEMKREVVGSFEVLQERYGAVEHFAWPYGLQQHIYQKAWDTVFEAGYKSIASGIRGCHINNFDKDEQNLKTICIWRDNIELNWPLNHILYFLRRNAQSANPTTPFFKGIRNQ